MEQKFIPTIEVLQKAHRNLPMTSLLNLWGELVEKLNSYSYSSSLLEQMYNWHKFLVVTRIIKKRGFWAQDESKPRFIGSTE